MPPSTAILDAVDARIRQQQQPAQTPAQTPTVTVPYVQPDYQVSGASAPPPPPLALVPTYPKPSNDRAAQIIEQWQADSDARQAALAQQWEETQEAFRQPIPEYAVRGAPVYPASDLVAQGQQHAQTLRQPEWWAQGLVGGGNAIGNALRYLFSDDTYEERMLQDPVYRELRRAALMEKLQASLQDASAYARSGKDDLARLSLKHAETYSRSIVAIDRL